MAIITLGLNPEQSGQLRQDLAGFKNGFPKVVTAAINRTLLTGRSIVVKRLAKELRLTQKEIRAVTSIRKANYQKLSGSVHVTKNAIPLMQFKPKQTRAGVTVSVRRGKPRELLRGTFIATMKNGHVDVFERERLGGGKRAGRLKIKKRFGPTPAGILLNAPGVIQDVMGEVGPVFQKNLRSQTDRLLDRRKSAAEKAAAAAGG